MIYIYRPALLEKDMNVREASEILRGKGYIPEEAGRCVAELACRLRSYSDTGEFPHEIGLFLGYPPEDVKGFMNHRREGCRAGSS